ncbi:uncharacterized protein LOC124891892 isoform X2 [Capsicum annuum]|uniref:uncharacterized protein LOC124891892 isoform X2 n=1 Tax=Capsicum annuum TaxID=4072 RepID=UPI001FB09E41|nr:uncharacterized protein LOC124891892 isoform X2 [Capsicum annuum]
MYYFSLISILKRLYASHTKATDMTWHPEHIKEDGVIRHPSDSEALKNFNESHLFFADEPRNVRLGLCIDGFQPFSQSGRKYSSWPVIVTPYNLPPGMCMKEAYMFLTVIVPRPKNPKHKIDVYLQPLIKELTLLCETGEEAFDISIKQNFQLREALMWTISDFPTYSMLSGWSTVDPNFGDFYGRIKEIIEVEYREAPLKQIVLFKCEWFDPNMDVGVKKHNQYKLVDINHHRRYKNYEPFILAIQATQVCYVSYPSKKKNKDDWAVVLKIKPLNVVELPDEKIETAVELNIPFQAKEVQVYEIDMNVATDESIHLHDPNGGLIKMNELIDDGLLQEHHEIQEDATKEEYETKETEDNDDEDFEEDTDSD